MNKGVPTSKELPTSTIIGVIVVVVVVVLGIGWYLVNRESGLSITPETVVGPQTRRAPLSAGGGGGGQAMMRRATPTPTQPSKVAPLLAPQ